LTATHTLPLDTNDVALEIVGGKGRSLSKMTVAGFPVPSGFLLTTAAYRRFVVENELQAQIIELAKPEIIEKTVSFESASVRIRALFEKALISDEMRAVIKHAYGVLGEGEPAVAVRSSANAEDLSELSFAGQQDTYLNVRGEDALVSAVRDCWASLWTTRAISYRHENGIDQDKVAMAVVVQVMVPAEVSGILFTANPATGERSEMIVNASFGLGEAIVGGQITPDTYLVDRETLKAKETMIGTKEQMIVSDGEQGTRLEDVADSRRETESLSDALLSELAAMAVKVEQHFAGVPQDIEWAVADGKLWMLQSRPITNLPLAPLKNVKWELPDDVPPWAGVIAQRKLSEHIPGPISPLFEDVYLDSAIHDANMEMLDRFGMDTKGHKGHFTVNGFVYMGGGRPPILERYRDGMETPPRRINPPNHEQTEAIWRDEQVPKYLAVIDKWRNIDLAATPGAELFEGIKEIAHADAVYWFDGFLPVMLIVRGSESSFQGFLEQYGGGEFISGHFLTGMTSVAMAAEEQMLAIVLKIRSDASVNHLVLGTPAPRLLAVLRQHEAAADVVKEIDAYLEKYGHEVQTLDFAEPTAGEDPTNVMLNLKALVAAPDYDPAARQQELARKREEALRRADEHFVGEAEKTHLANRTDRNTDPIRFELNPEFHRMLEQAKRYYYLREAGLFYLACGWPVLRGLALGLGRRLVEVGTLGDANQVFYLRAGQLEEAIAAESEGKAVPALHRSAIEQIELKAARARLRNPPQIPIPKADGHQQESRGMGGMRMKGNWVLGSVQMINPEGATLEGYACSPGQVTGEASVILSPADFGNMQPGTILVCPMTTPAWTHLFSQAIGLVTDVGGILSHGSIVAREYDIPAVLGTGDITERIASGQRIAVDGDRGVVEILADD